MKVVLLKSVDNLGQAGQVSDVKPGYFRNYLEPRLMALRATTGNLKVVESKKKKLEAMVATELTDAKEIQGRLEGQTLVFKLRAGEAGRLFGSVTTREVVERIKEDLQIEVERRKVEMDNLKTLGDHHVRIRIYPGVAATINVKIEPLALRPEEIAEAEAAAAGNIEDDKHSAAAAWVDAAGDDDDDE